MWHNQVKLAINKDGRGRQWIDTVINRGLGAKYVFIVEVEPNTLLCYTDVWCWRVELEP